MDDHSSAAPVTRAVKLPTRTFGLKRPCGGLWQARPNPRKVPIRHCSGWGLPYRPGCPVRGGLLPHRFTITLDASGRSPTPRQSLLCGAFPEVAPAGRYPAPLLHGVRTFLEGCPPRSSSHPRERWDRGNEAWGQWGCLGCEMGDFTRATYGLYISINGLYFSIRLSLGQLHDPGIAGTGPLRPLVPTGTPPLHRLGTGRRAKPDKAGVGLSALPARTLTKSGGFIPPHPREVFLPR